MTNALRDIRHLAPADWRVLRDIRLQALRDSPNAFTSRYYAELGWSEHQWRRRFDAGTWVVAFERGVAIGLAGLVDGQEPHEGRHVEWIWVAPTRRHRGVFRSLLASIAELGRRAGLTVLMLWVLEDNTAALRTYLSLGFVPTGECQPIAPGARRCEMRLQLVI